MDSKSKTKAPKSPKRLSVLDSTQPHTFLRPTKRICEGHDVPQFLTSKAYGDIGAFVMQLNISMCPRKDSNSEKDRTWQLDTPEPSSEVVRKLQELLQGIDGIIEEAPPETGPRRFGNVSFRRWYGILESRAYDLLQTYLPAEVLSFGSSSEGISAIDEIVPYFLGSFGSPQRLDYGTGHELSFLAFLGCIWKLGGFSKGYTQDGSLERSIVIGIIEPYLRVIRHLILTYTLEPAGSHGVWGLDDHSFLPYIFGSAQYCPAIQGDDAMPVEGSLPEAPDPGDVAKRNVVDREKIHNMYFAAIGFINDVKTGPFWEHSPILFDISGVRSGWGKINKGMIKMYNAEVLSKFPVVQHFPFGSLFSWEQDINASPQTQSVHTMSQPTGSSRSAGAQMVRPPPAGGTNAPWAVPAHGAGIAQTITPWTQAPTGPPQPGMPPTRPPWASKSRANPGGQASLQDTQHRNLPC